MDGRLRRGKRRPPVDSSFRPTLDVWLSKISSDVAEDPAVWMCIKTKRISFLSATSATPDPVLSPLAKRIRYSLGPETEKDSHKRFHQDRRQRRCIQCAAWRMFDGLESLSERWPAPARLILNRLTDGPEAAPFQSLIDNFPKERRFHSIWVAFITSLLHSFDENALYAMGLNIETVDDETVDEDSDDTHDWSLMELQEASLIDGCPIDPDYDPGLIEIRLKSLFTEWLTETNPSADSNPLYWWVTILVRSAISGGPDDYISSGRFSSNVIPMDLDIRGRLEAILHHAKLLIDHVYHTWQCAAR